MPGPLLQLALLPFASPGLLWWAAAAAVPLLLHFWSRRQFRQTPWAAMDFLLAAIRKSARRMVLEQWLLLLVRMAILLLLAVALAEPFFSPLPASLGGTHAGSTYTVLVLDGSLSMTCERDGKSRFARGQDKAAALVAAAPQGDAFSLIVMNDVPQTVIGEPAYDSQDVIAEIRAARPAHGGANLAAALADAFRRIRGVHEQRLLHRRVVLLTDLAASTWEAALRDEVAEQIQQTPAETPLLILDVDDQQRSNFAITRLAAQGGLVTVGGEQAFDVEARYFGEDVPAPRSVRLLVDDRVVEEQTLSFHEGETAAAQFRYRFNAPGEHLVVAEIASDQLTADDRRYLSLPVREAVRVLCVESRPGDAAELSLALASSGREGRQVHVERVRESQLAEIDLTAWQAVFLCNVTSLTADDAGLLHRFVDQGGGLVVLLGDQIDPASYNRRLGEEAGAKRVLPVEIGPLLGDDATVHFDLLACRHPITKAFDGTQRNGLVLAPVWRRWKLSPLRDAAAQTAVAFDTGEPALVEGLVGRGRCLVWATAASLASVDRRTQPPTPFTAVSSYGAFVPLMQGMLQFALRRPEQDRNVLVALPFAGSGALGSSAETITVTGPVGQPDEAVQRVPVRFELGRAAWTVPPCNLSGAYRARKQSGDEGEWFTANINPALHESNLERIDDAALPPPFAIVASAGDSVGAGPAGLTSVPYFRYFLLAALALLMVESYLAWRMGADAA